MMDTLALLIIAIVYHIIGLIFAVIDFILTLLLLPFTLLREAIIKKFGGSND